MGRLVTTEAPDTGDVPTIVVSYSELEAGRLCPHKHELAYKQRWQSPRVGMPLEIGKLWHAVLEAHYRELQVPGADRLQRARKAARKIWMSSGSAYASTAEFMYSQYVDQYGSDPKWKIVAVEHELVAPLPWPGHGPRFTIKGRIDLIIREMNRLLIVDHKAHRNLPDGYELALHDQFPIYEFLLDSLGKPVFGCVYNTTRYFIPKSGMWEDPDNYMERVPLYRTKEELAEIIREAVDDLNTIYGYAPGKAPRHPRPIDCKRCFFKDPCLTGRKRGWNDERDHLLNRGFIQDWGRH